MLESELALVSHIREFEVPRDQCAVVGVFSKSATDVSETAFNGLIELNHRGQESAGIAVANGQKLLVVKDSGLAGIVFTLKHPLPELPGAFVAIGHDRYSTSGSLVDAQPFVDRGIAVAHNGNLTNVKQLRARYSLPYEIDGARSDTRIALAVINAMPGDERERILRGIKELEGAYSFVFATKSALFASRDPLGIRPLSLGQLESGEGFAVASETAAFSSMRAQFVRDIFPGETVMIDDDGVKTIALDGKPRPARCIFELIYFARPDSVVYGIPVSWFRAGVGEILAAKYLTDVDIIMPVPKSGIAAAIGVAGSEIARSMGIAYREGLYTNPYRGVVDGARTFIRPNGRDMAATEKYHPVEFVVKRKRIALVDDSIVRGSLRLVIEKLRRAGTEEIHALIASPPLKHACVFGTDFGERELLANRIPDLEARRRYLGLDSLHHISYAEIIAAALRNKVAIPESELVFEEHGFCGACFTGRYPIPIDGVIYKDEQ